MRTLTALILATALSACASSQGPFRSSDVQPALHLGDRPQVIFVGTPAMDGLPQQVIGHERLSPDLS
jgi:hypothetical protein